MARKLFSTAWAIFILIGILACGGGFYKVTDPTSEKVYYTKDLEQKKGTVTLKDANTGNMVTLQNSEIQEINKEDFKANTKKE